MSTISNGVCVCGNRTFKQVTLVTFKDQPIETFLDDSGREKIRTEDLRKMLECAQCGARYIYAAHKDEWVNN